MAPPDTAQSAFKRDGYLFPLEIYAPAAAESIRATWDELEQVEGLNRRSRATLLVPYYQGA